MNRDQHRGNWLILKGKIKEIWGEITDDDLDVANGRLDQIAGTLQKKYGLAKEEAQRKLEALSRHLAHVVDD